MFSCWLLGRCGEGGDIVGIPFHADVFGNVVYGLSISSVVATENTLSPSGKNGVVGRFSDSWFLLRAFRGRWYEVRALGMW